MSLYLCIRRGIHGWPHPFIKNGVDCTTVCGESYGCLPRSALPAYALRSAVGTLSLSTRATVPQPGLFSCAFVSKLNGYWLVCVMSVDNELLRVSVEAAVGAALKCVLWLCLCRTASLRNSRNIKDAYIGGHYIECVCVPYAVILLSLSTH